VPAVGHLHGVGSAKASAFGVGPGPIARDKRHTRMSRQPGGKDLGGAFAEQINRTSGVEINQDRAVALAFA